MATVDFCFPSTNCWAYELKLGQLWVYGGKILRMTFTGYWNSGNGLPKHSYIQLRAGTRALRALVLPLTVCTRAWENPFPEFQYPVKVTFFGNFLIKKTIFFLPKFKFYMNNAFFWGIYCWFSSKFVKFDFFCSNCTLTVIFWFCYAF